MKKTTNKRVRGLITLEASNPRVTPLIRVRPNRGSPPHGVTETTL